LYPKSDPRDEIYPGPKVFTYVESSISNFDS